MKPIGILLLSALLLSATGALAESERKAAGFGSTGEPILILWDLLGGRVEVSIGKANAVKQVNAEKNGFDSQGDVFLFDTHKEILELLTATIADMRPLVAEPQVSGLLQDDTGIDDGGSSGSVCGGSEFRGTGIGDARSFACRNATNDVSIKCWNRYCIGCCRLDTCDAACFIDDYGCLAGRTGWACSGLT